MLLLKERNDIVRFGQKLVNSGLTVATGGNLSVADRRQGLIVISPSAVDYSGIKPSNVVALTMEGEKVEGRGKPSSELPLHLALYRKRGDIQAVVHTHSVYATTVASLGWEIPFFHYLVGFSGKKVPLARYATFGSEELALNVAQAIEQHNAVLMENHGVVAVGATLAAAFSVAEIVEYLARIYCQVKGLGTPAILSEEEMEKVIKKLKAYK
ncbi:MAG: class II aldolase/adducin family protein [Deltaproteobacteria bacterium]|nr:class II aldolase/adducin family protein [Deltaproteobacteria bacterium]